MYIVSSYKVGSEHVIDGCFTEQSKALDYVRTEFGTKFFESHNDSTRFAGDSEVCRFNNGVDFVVIIHEAPIK